MKQLLSQHRVYLLEGIFPEMALYQSSALQYFELSVPAMLKVFEVNLLEL